MTNDLAKLFNKLKEERKVDMTDFHACLEKDLGKDLPEMKSAVTFINELFENIEPAFQSVVSDNVNLEEANVLEEERVHLRLSENWCRVT